MDRFASWLVDRGPEPVLAEFTKAAIGTHLGEMLDRVTASTWGVEGRLKVRAKMAGVEGLHAHRFRHTFAGDWLAAGGQEPDLMRLAGWSSDARLQVYGRATADQRAQDAHRWLKRGDRL